MLQIAFDIETGPLDSETVMQRSKPFEPKSGATKKETIDKQREDYEKDCLERAPLKAETGKVLCIGYFDGTVYRYLGGNEHDILVDFWDVAGKAQRAGDQLFGFNIAKFDVPFLIRRSWYTGVHVGCIAMTNDRYLHHTFYDLAEKWRMGVYGDYISLDILARCLGLQGKLGHGADFHRLWNGTEADRNDALEYLKRDLDITYDAGIALGVVLKGRANESF